MPFKANAARRHHIPKQRYRVCNWQEYDAALRARGSLTVWFSDEAVERWRAETRSTPGGQRTYSDLAILTALMLRAVYRLALRQTEGLVASLVQVLGLDLAVPDHSTLSRRAKTVTVPTPLTTANDPVRLLVDSSGVKLCGPGDWLIEKHGTRRRRAWRKLHIGLDAATGRIVAATLTDHDVDDASQVGPLLDRIGEADVPSPAQAEAAHPLGQGRLHPGPQRVHGPELRSPFALARGLKRFELPSIAQRHHPARRRRTGTVRAVRTRLAVSLGELHFHRFPAELGTCRPTRAFDPSGVRHVLGVPIDLEGGCGKTRCQARLPLQVGEGRPDQVNAEVPCGLDQKSGVEVTAAMGSRAFIRTTQLYGRRGEAISLDEIERSDRCKRLIDGGPIVPLQRRRLQATLTRHPALAGWRGKPSTSARRL